MIRSGFYRWGRKVKYYIHNVSRMHYVVSKKDVHELAFNYAVANIEKFLGNWMKSILLKINGCYHL
jgi:hypothetical protein